jgi:hypothetical protein
MVIIKDADIIIQEFDKKYKYHDVNVFFYQLLYNEYATTGLSEKEIYSLAESYIPIINEVYETLEDKSNIGALKKVNIFKTEPKELLKFKNVPQPKKEEKPQPQQTFTAQDYLVVVRGEERFKSKAIWSDSILLFEINNYINEQRTSNVVEYVISKTYPFLDTPYMIWKSSVMNYLKLDWPQENPSELEKILVEFTNKVTTYEKVKINVGNMLMIKNNPDQVVLKAYKQAVEEYPRNRLRGFDETCEANYC